MRGLLLTTLLLLSVAVAVVSSTAGGSVDGIGWEPYEEIDAHIIRLAKFAVTENNKKLPRSAQLRLVKVLHADYESYPETAYRIDMVAAGGGRSSTAKYEAIVAEYSLDNIQLWSFKKLGN